MTCEFSFFHPRSKTIRKANIGNSMTKRMAQFKN